MKRVSINIDLEENEVFDKETLEIVRAKVREIVRNQYDEVILATAQKEVQRLFDAQSYEYKDKLNVLVKRCIEPSIKSAVSTLDLPSIARDTAARVVDEKIANYRSELETRVKGSQRITLSITITPEQSIQ